MSSFFVPPRSVGILCLAMVIVLWSVANYAIQLIDTFDPNYGQPLLLNYVSCCSLIVFLFLTVFPDPLQLYALAAKKRGLLRHQNVDIHTASSNEDGLKATKPIGKLQAMAIALPFTLLYFAANYFSTASFMYGYLSTVTMLMNASGVFSLTLGRIFGIEELSIFKIVSVFFTLSGIAILKIFEYEQHDPNKQPLRGNIYAIASAFFYGCYSTYLKRVVGEGDDQLVSSSTMFGLVGLFSIVLLWPVIVVLYVMKEITFVKPPSGAIVGILLLYAFFGTVVPNYAWSAAVMFTGTLLVALGLSFMSPVSIVADCIEKGNFPPSYKLVSMALILIGFFFINLASIRPNWDRTIMKTKGK